MERRCRNASSFFTVMYLKRIRKVIKTFFEYGKLKAIPAQRKKQRICLEEIAKSFESNKTYEEKEVNEIIRNYHEDVCTIRRDMISEHIMEREGSVYKLK